MHYSVTLLDKDDSVLPIFVTVSDFLANPFFRLSNQNLTVWFSSVATVPEMCIMRQRFSISTGHRLFDGVMSEYIDDQDHYFNSMPSSLTSAPFCL